MWFKVKDENLFCKKKSLSVGNFKSFFRVKVRQMCEKDLS